jgi:hypothetical protein
MKTLRIIALVLFTAAANAQTSGKSAPKSDGIASARAAVEANLKTAEGKKYDDEFHLKDLTAYQPQLMACAKTNTPQFFVLYIRLTRDGTVAEILSDPPAKIALCLRQALLSGKFSRPPKPSYWVEVSMAFGGAPTGTGISPASQHP